MIVTEAAGIYLLLIVVSVKTNLLLRSLLQLRPAVRDQQRRAMYMRHQINVMSVLGFEGVSSNVEQFV